MHWRDNYIRHCISS